ncbi:MAG: endonuclease/exonuclease/phosphatase family protein [Anaerolineae bacterium]|nr:endonuclease/exonuclease/phosphatase family protein [Anaerolineae bacterium]
MKVLTYNVHGWIAPDGGANVDRVAEVIARAGADIVGLNEVFHPLGEGALPALAVLAERLGMGFAFGATQSSEPHPAHPPYGNAVLSRWPIMAHAAHHLAPAVAYGKRGLLEARILLPSGRPLTIYVTHLDHRSEEVRLAQWASADTWLARDRSRFHLALGDFNALAASDYASAGALERLAAYQRERDWPTPAFDLVGRVMKSGYEDAYCAVGGAEAGGATWPAEAPERRIDYIFLPKAAGATARSCSPVDEPAAVAASDHLPVLAEIDV